MKKERKLYKIGHITKTLGITPRTVRYYDQMGLLPHVKRSEGGVRLFDDEDIVILRNIRKLQKEDDLPLDVIKVKLFGEKGAAKLNKKAVVTDSTASLPSKLSDIPFLKTIPIQIKVGGETTQDSSKTESKMWAQVRKEGAEPIIEAVSEADFISTYTGLQKKGLTEIYSVHLSPEFSKTAQNARTAALKVKDIVKVTVIDTKSMGAGLGLLVQLLVEGINEQYSTEEMDLLVQKNSAMVADIITTSDLKFYMNDPKNETNPAKQMIMNTITEWQPVLSIKQDKGMIEVVDCCRNRSEAVTKILEHFEEEVECRGGYLKKVAITHGHLCKDTKALAAHFEEHHPTVPITFHQNSAVLSTYVGPESISVSFI